MRRASLRTRTFEPARSFQATPTSSTRQPERRARKSVSGSNEKPSIRCRRQSTRATSGW